MIIGSIAALLFLAFEGWVVTSENEFVRFCGWAAIVCILAGWCYNVVVSVLFVIQVRYLNYDRTRAILIRDDRMEAGFLLAFLGAGFFTLLIGFGWLAAGGGGRHIHIPSRH